VFSLRSTGASSVVRPYTSFSQAPVKTNPLSIEILRFQGAISSVVPKLVMINYIVLTFPKPVSGVPSSTTIATSYSTTSFPPTEYIPKIGLLSRSFPSPSPVVVLRPIGPCIPLTLYSD